MGPSVRPQPLWGIHYVGAFRKKLIKRVRRAWIAAWLGTLLMAGAVGMAGAGDELSALCSEQGCQHSFSALGGTIDYSTGFNLDVMFYAIAIAGIMALAYGCGPIVQLTKALRRVEQADALDEPPALRIRHGWDGWSTFVAGFGCLLMYFNGMVMSFGIDPAYYPHDQVPNSAATWALLYGSLGCAFGALVCGVLLIILVGRVGARAAIARPQGDTAMCRPAASGHVNRRRALPRDRRGYGRRRAP